MSESNHIQFSEVFGVSMDAKGRFAVPAKYRKQLTRAGQESIRLALGPGDRCLRGYTEEAFSELMERVRQMEDKRLMSVLKRKIMSNLAHLDFDSQGRVLVPGHLRQQALLDGEVVVVGCDEYFEVWSAEAWEAERQAEVGLLEENDEELLQVFS